MKKRYYAAMLVVLLALLLLVPGAGNAISPAPAVTPAATEPQDALARAQQNSIIALTRHADAKMALARALGDTEKTYRDFLGIK